jgi:deoxyribodipyrimidine photo-lyase
MIFQQQLKNHNIQLIITNEDKYQNILFEIKKNHIINEIQYNKSYESYWINLENSMNNWAHDQGIKTNIFPSNNLMDPMIIRNKNNQNYKVFTPFWKYLQEQTIDPIISINIDNIKGIDCCIKDIDIQAEYKDFLFHNKSLHQFWKPGENEAQRVLKYFIENNLINYKDFRNFPINDCTSKLSPYLRSGEISSKQVYWAIKNSSIEDSLKEPFLRQLGWREFSFHLLAYYPHMELENLHKEFDNFPWDYNDIFYQCWQNGTTGFPIIDAAMRELKSTGWIHNRLRLIVGSFLTKDLRIHWTKGAQHFWQYLMDADEANNSASWQWVAGCGMDAAPYYRIFNPVIQSSKFDPEGLYIKKWVPELKNVPGKLIHDPWNHNLSIYNENHYPYPIIDHKIAKNITLELYFNFINKKSN